MAEEATDVTPTVEEPVATGAVEPTTEATSSEAEQTAVEPQDESTTAQEEAPSEKTVMADSQEPETEGATPNETEGLKPKSQVRFQKLANENRVLKEELRQLKELQVPSKEDYIEDGDDELTASVKALEADRAQEKAVNQIVELNQFVDTDIEKAMREFPLLNPQSKEFNPSLAQSLMEQYDSDSGAQYVEQNGQQVMISTSQLPYEYIKSKMDLIGIVSANAKVQAQKNVESMVAQADTPMSTAPQTENQNETIEQMRDRLANVKF